MQKETFYEAVHRNGVSRRDFLKFCLMMTASLGFDYSMFPTVVKALESKPRPPVYWLNFAACTCCTESVIKAAHPLASEAILSIISLDYMETIQAAAGHQAEEIISKGMKENAGEYILLVEGSVPFGAEGMYCSIGGRPAIEVLKEAAANAKLIMSIGACSSFGCITTADPNPTECKPIYKIITDKQVVNVSGCPPIPDVIMGTIVHLIAFGEPPEVDLFHRPKAFYGVRIHDNCYRRAYFDSGMFVTKFDDEAARQGYCLYKMGCRGPTTYNDCAVMKWNNGVSYPIQSGHPCIGCSEPGYWDNKPLYQHLSDVPYVGLGTPDNIGEALAIGVAFATGAHLVASGVKKARMKKPPEPPDEQKEKEE
ncbi:MAG: hydrogenase small subunit [Calditrichia bacterium]